MVCVPPAVGGEVLTKYSEPSAGAVGMLTPLVPSRFSAPQLTPVPGSPSPALPSPLPSAGKVVFGPYEIVIDSLAGPVFVPRWKEIQSSKVWVVGLLKFLTWSQSTTIQPRLGPAVRVATRIAPAEPGLRSVQSGAMTLFGRAPSGNDCGNGVASVPEPPPTTSVPLEPTPIEVYGSPP